MRKSILFIMALSMSLLSFGYDWDETVIGPDAGTGNIWELQENLSDDFSYIFNGSTVKENFGSDKWYDFYHNSWDGPGNTHWNPSQVSVDGSDLVITVAKYASGNITGVKSGCVTSNNKVKIGSYVEASLSVANITLASCFWLLSPDDTQEIDIIENYGATPWYGSMTHISHHSFVRSPFTDYQPKDHNSWYAVSGVSNWGEYCWNDGDRIYMKMGVYWKAANHFEYYINGELIRVMYYNATATKIGSTWQYQYFNTLENRSGYNFPVNDATGYTDVTTHSTSTEYDFVKLQAASTASPNSISVIDPGNFQGAGNGFTKDLDIIINMESQDWLEEKYTPSDADLANTSKNKMKVDWVRVYKPVTGTSITTGIKIDKKQFEAYNGASFELSAVVLPVTASSQEVTWKSENTGIATVDANGLVECVGAGDVAIVVTSKDLTQTDTCYVSSSAQPVIGTLEFDNPSQYDGAKFESGTSIKVACNFNATTLHVVDGNGIRVQVQEIDANGDVVKFKQGIASSAANLESGTASASVLLRSITPTADLPSGHYYRLYAEYGQVTNMGEESDTIICSSTVDNIIIIAAVSGIDEVNSEDLAIYPNPSTGVFNVECSKDAKVEVYSVVGVKIFETEIIGDETLPINLTEFGSGVYIVKVDNVFRRIVIE